MACHPRYSPLLFLLFSLICAPSTLAAVIPRQTHSKPHHALADTNTAPVPTQTTSAEEASNKPPNAAHIGIGVGVTVTVLVIACVGGLYYRRHLARNTLHDKSKVDISQVNAFLDEVRASKVPLVAVTPSPPSSSPPRQGRTSTPPQKPPTYVREYTGHSAARGVSIYSYASHDVQSDRGSVYSRETYEAYTPASERAMPELLGMVKEEKSKAAVEERRPLVSEDIEAGSHRA